MDTKVVLFSTPTCGWCRKLKDYLRQNNIRYQDVDVSNDTKATQDMIRKSGNTAVPQMWINNKPIVGFDKNKIDKMLKIT